MLMEYLNIVIKGVFKGVSNISQEAIEERILPEGKKTVKPSSSRQTGSVKSQLEKIRDSTRQLRVSRDDLMRLGVDCEATLDSADQMMHRASEWFQMMLDDLEKRIKDENILVMKHQNFMQQHIDPILQKLKDLTVLYETLNFLDKKTSLNDQTMRTSKRNIQLARESIAKVGQLLSKDSKMKASSTVKSELVPLAAELSTAFTVLEEALLEVMSFTLSSPAATRLLETILTQMTGIHRVVMREVWFFSRTQLACSLEGRGTAK
ncbi:hypothetical protein COOONC_11522 [Cooperia oncophora]